MWKWEAEGSAKAVIVIVHGAMEHHGRYGWLIEMWRSSGYHVVMGDLPGQGMTSRSQRGHIDSFDDYIIEVKDWIQAAYQFDLPVFLLGHSMGGLIAIRAIQEHKLNLAGVILSSPCVGLVKYPPKIVGMISYGLNALMPTVKFPSGLTIDMATRNEEVREIDVNDTLYVTKVSVRWYRELVHAMKLAFANMSKIPDLPLLVMQAGDDKIVNKTVVKDWFNQVPMSEKHFKEWTKCYHEIYNEPEREEVFAYSKSFIDNRLRSLGYVVE
ncbi:alpha/beta hydrolase [Falsibacillus pallidus]|uniref:Lysophospholipase n=1 Tax=Falsibacillus pallidus TaxID=493781 RepID=A0A370GKZ6_9BACI|nr:alpha/beta hydrolase [Falsibacillus pallidus]RDI44351.1 lysophospholipase [Falsibacillus pallidus]